MIDPRPLEDVSAITFLGAELAAKHPVVTTWQVPPPSDRRLRQVDDARARTCRCATSRSRTPIPVLQGYKNSVGIGYHFNFEDPIRFANFGITAAYTPAGNLPGDERGHVDIDGQLPRLARRAVVEPVRFLRPVRADQAQPQGLRRQARLRLAADLRRAAQARRELRSRLLRQDRHAAERAERRHHLHPAARLRESACTTPTCVARSAQSTTRRESRGRSWLTGNHVNGDTVPQVRGTLDVGFRAAAGAFLAVAAQRRRRVATAIAATRSPTSTSAASATTTSTTARSSAIASTTRCRASRSTRSAGRTSCARWSNGTCRRSSSSRSARRAST